MSQPLLSIIVPVYKVEDYLCRCLDSILAQTYENFELILVDDGSPDGCGAICDRYAQQDPRVKVIHKENGGVSSARNAGLAQAKGEWIGWVDPDDWVDEDMYAYLMTAVLEEGADVAVCGRIEEYEDHTRERGWEERRVLDREEAMHYLLLNDDMQNLLWDKVWKRSIFDGLQFWQRRTYEDIAIMHQLFERCQRMVCLPEAKYHYFQRPTSIVSDQSLGNKINHYAAARLRREQMWDTWPQFRDLLEAQCVASSINAWCVYYSNPKQVRKQYHKDLEEMSRFAKEHYQSALTHMNLGPTGRAVLRLTPYTTWWSFRLAQVCNWLYKRKHGKSL